jgi:hypothetical protein
MLIAISMKTRQRVSDASGSQGALAVNRPKSKEQILSNLQRDSHPAFTVIVAQ